MTDFFSNLLRIATLVFAVSSMLSVGFSYTVRQIIDPLRNARLVIGALVANFVLVPLLAFAVTRVLSLGQARNVGLILVASAAGAPFLIKLTQAAGSDLAVATGLLVLLLVVTIVYMPGVVPLIVPGSAVSASSIARPLVLTMLLPLVVGLVVHPLIPTWTDRLLPLLGPVSTVALVVLVMSTVLADFRPLLLVSGTGAILAVLLLIGGAFAFGYLLGDPKTGTRDELGLATGQRNIAAATVVATQSVGNPDTVVMVVVTSMVRLAILFPLAGALGRRAERGVQTEATRKRRKQSMD